MSNDSLLIQDTKTMVRQTIILAFTFLLVLSSSGQNKDEIYLNYVAALNNESTFQYFIVVKVKNLNNGLTGEYCTIGNFLKVALHIEYKLGYKCKGISKVYSIAFKNKERYFEFKSKKAIGNIEGIGRYSIDDLAQLEKKINFDSLANEIRQTGNWSMEIFDDKIMLMYAHALFNRGILTGENNCVGGTLFYVNRNKAKD